MTKERLKELLEKANNKVYVVGLKTDSYGIWKRFAVYVLIDNKPFRFFFEKGYPEAPSHWVERHKTKSGNWSGGYFESGVIGMDRIADIVMGISRWAYDGNNYKIEHDFLSW